jgi:hypothetical protein
MDQINEFSVLRLSGSVTDLLKDNWKGDEFKWKYTRS